MSIRSEQLIQQLKALSDRSRMRLAALCQHGECSVSELTQVLDQSQPRVSQHLKALCESGLLVRHRDGKRVYYRVPSRGSDLSTRRALLTLVPIDERIYEDDYARLRALRGEQVERRGSNETDQAERAIYRAILDLTITAPVGALLDIGCGRGQILKLLATRANRAVGVDIDADARELARAELLLANIPNCSLRKGDMYRLPFDGGEFDTIVMDDVLGRAKKPVHALAEARRLLKPGGRMLLLGSVNGTSAADLQSLFAKWSADAGLRMAPARLATPKDPRWLLAVATVANSNSEAA